MTSSAPLTRDRPPVTGPDSGPETPFPIRLSGPVIKGFGRGSKELGIPTANIPSEGLSAYPDLDVGVYYGVVALDPETTSSTTTTTTTTTGNQNQNQTGDGDGDGDDDKESESKGKEKGKAKILPAVLSIGYNPFYKNRERSVEIHILPELDRPAATFTSSSPSPSSSSPSLPAEENSKGQGGRKVKFNKLPDFYGTRLNLLMLGYIRPEYDYVSLEALIEDIRVDCEVARRSLLRGGYAVYLSDVAGDGGEGVSGEREWLGTF